MIEIELSWREVWVATQAGVMRNLEARRKNRPETHGKASDAETSWGLHIEGAAAELAVAKWLNAYWDPVWAVIDRSRDDVGGVQVRSTRRSRGSLILHSNDLDAPFVFVVGEIPRFVIVGWIRGGDGKQQRWWRADTGRPAFFVPQDALNEPETLVEELAHESLSQVTTAPWLSRPTGKAGCSR